jgi:hypothetical protein
MMRRKATPNQLLKKPRRALEAFPNGTTPTLFLGFRLAVASLPHQEDK